MAMFREVEALFHIRKDIVHVSVRNNKLFSQTRLSVGVVSSTDKIPENYIIKAIVLDKEFANHADVSRVRRMYPSSFLAIYDPSAAQNPKFRLDCFNIGANMVAHDLASLLYTIQVAVLPSGQGGGRLECPYCRQAGFTEQELWYHCPAYHINWPQEVHLTKECPICRKKVNQPMQVHIHEEHKPRKLIEIDQPHYRTQPAHEPVMDRGSGVTQLYNFSLVICRHPVSGHFLLCQEFADQGFWCPGGAVDAGESFRQAAIRETIEEAGIEVELRGVLGIEYNPIGRSNRTLNELVRMRVIFYAEPTAIGLHQLPKSVPDFESAGACWCSYEDIHNGLKLRGSEPIIWSRYLMEGRPIYPMEILIEKDS